MTLQTDAAADRVHVAVEGRCGMIMLDRPEALNALTAPMIRAIHAALRRFENDTGVEIVVIGSTRAGCFCAGGDIRQVRAARLAGRDEDADAFFAEEFALNLAIATYPKPYVALIDGVCMGGGLGISVHGAHRVVTDRLTMAMPETAIGYFPDVGASYFLNALPPGEIGLYLALTGERLSAQDALYCGLATSCVRHEDLGDLRAALVRSGREEERGVIDRFSYRGEPGPVELNRNEIDAAFGANDLVEIFRRLEESGGAFAEAALEKMRAASPSSLRVTFELLRSARGRSLAECLRDELTLARTVTRSADFAEGVRAMLVDKDRAPRWRDTAG